MLSEKSVNWLFSRLGLRYGADWLRKWEGYDIQAVKADWAIELACLDGKKDVVKYALQHLPQKPPTAMAFLEICAQMPLKAAPGLPAPKANPYLVSEAIKAILGVRDNDTDPKAWAWRLKKREDAGERLTLAQRTMWRESIKYDLEALEACEIIPVDQDA